MIVSHLLQILLLVLLDRSFIQIKLSLMCCQNYNYLTNNPEQILKNNIIKSLDTGLRKLEIPYIKQEIARNESLCCRLVIKEFIFV